MATVNDLRTGTISENDLIRRLCLDDRLSLTETRLNEILDQGRHNVGAARSQVAQFVAKVSVYEKKYPAAAAYVPGGIL